MARQPTKNNSLSTASEVDNFISTAGKSANSISAASSESGKLIFALDATASRQATWNQASELQARMFTNTRQLAQLELQLVYFRGYDECRASPWLNNADSLLKMMRKISCIAGTTQISRVLKHAVAETKKQQVQALVYVGDCIEENVDKLGEIAGQLKLYGLPVFVFQEGYDPVASIGFRQIAAISGGVHRQFDHNSAHELGKLLNAAAVYAAGGKSALELLENQGSREAGLLLKQLR